VFVIFLWSLTTGIAIVALYTSEWKSFHRRLLPWTGGVLVGVSLFWIVPDVAEVEGWSIASAGILAGLTFLVMIDRYVYTVCPLCALGTHAEATHSPTDSIPVPSLRAGWLVLVAGCIHNFFDGWLVAFPLADTHAVVSSALSFGFAFHKIPEAFALGLLAGVLSSTSARGLGVVLLVQASFALGIFSVLSTKVTDLSLVSACLVAAGATLLFFGLNALQAELRNRGVVPALKAGIFGVCGCGLAAVAFHFIH